MPIRFAKVTEEGVPFKDTQKKLLRLMAESVERHARVILDTIRSGMRDEVKLGHVYIRENGRIHIASAPGQYPAVDSGRLFRSLRLRMRRFADGAEAEVSTTVPYAQALQDGTWNMKPRPIIRPKMGDDFVMDARRIIEKVYSS